MSGSSKLCIYENKGELNIFKEQEERMRFFETIENISNNHYGEVVLHENARQQKLEAKKLGEERKRKMVEKMKERNRLEEKRIEEENERKRIDEEKEKKKVEEEKKRMSAKQNTWSGSNSGGATRWFDYDNEGVYYGDTHSGF